MKIVKSKIISSALIRPLQKYNDKLCINTKYENLIVRKNEISYLKAENNYCRIILLDGRVIICSKTLKEMYRRIANPKFIKIHKSYVVNANSITSLDPYYVQLTLQKGVKVPISRARKSYVKEVVNNMFD